MAQGPQFLSHQSSSCYDRKKQGCMDGLFRFFQLYYRHHFRRSLTLTRHDGGKYDASKQRLSIPLDEGENAFSDQEKVALIADQNPRSRKRGMRFIFSKLSWKKLKKQKASKSDPSLLHASSEHHSECKDNDFPDEISSGKKNSTDGLDSHAQNSDAMINHAKTPSNSLRESCEAFNISCSNRMDGFVNEFFEDRECDTNNFHDLQDPNAKPGFTKSISFPAPGSPRGLSRLKQNESKVMPLMVKSRSSSGFEPSFGDYDELRIPGDGGNVSNHWKYLRLRLKDITAGNTKEHQRISLDGVLDKIPYGQKSFEDGKENSRYRPTQRSVFGSGNITRSRSLTDSLVSYSRLLKSTSFKEPEKLPERSKQEQKDVLHDNRGQRSWGRIVSNPEFFDSIPPTMSNLASDIGAEQYILVGQAELDGDDAEGVQDIDDHLVDEMNRAENNSEGNKLDEPESLVAPMELSDFHVHLDPKDKPAFHFVKDVLKISGFWGETMQTETCPSLLPPWSSEHSYHNPETLEQQMLFDLMNVVLLEIYENCFSMYSAFLHWNTPCVRPLPVGMHVLEEVWAKISWHLGSGKQRITTLEDLMARDFSRGDEWLDLRRDSETVDSELEDWILDDLLDEVLDHLDELVSTSDCAVSS